MFNTSLARSVLRNRAVIVNKNLPMRGIKLHEYQAAQLLKKFNVAVPYGTVAFNEKEANKAAK